MRLRGFVGLMCEVRPPPLSPPRTQLFLELSAELLFVTQISREGNVAVLFAEHSSTITAFPLRLPVVSYYSKNVTDSLNRCAAGQGEVLLPTTSQDFPQFIA